MAVDEQQEPVAPTTKMRVGPEDPATPLQGSVCERVEARYRPSGEDGEIVVYAGDLAVQDAAGEHARRLVSGQFELRLASTPAFAAQFAAGHTDLLFPAPGDDHAITVPPGAGLTPPVRSMFAPVAADTGPVGPLTMNALDAGELASARRFIFHVSGALEACLPMVPVDGGHQPQLAFSLTGWDLVLAPVDKPQGEHDFAFVVQATPRAPRTTTDVDELHRRLFILLSFITSREVGVSPICGPFRQRKLVLG